MNSKNTATSKTRKSGNRTTSQGNILWKYYRELGETSINNFKDLLLVNNIPLTTFYADTYLNKNLGTIPLGRILLFSKIWI